MALRSNNESGLVVVSDAKKLIFFRFKIVISCNIYSIYQSKSAHTAGDTLHTRLPTRAAVGAAVRKDTELKQKQTLHNYHKRLTPIRKRCTSPHAVSVQGNTERMGRMSGE